MKFLFSFISKYLHAELILSSKRKVSKIRFQRHGGEKCLRLACTATLATLFTVNDLINARDVSSKRGVLAVCYNRQAQILTYGSSSNKSQLSWLLLRCS